MTDIVKLSKELAKPEYAGLSDKEAHSTLNAPEAVPIPPPPPEPSKCSIAVSIGFGPDEVSVADVTEARKMLKP